MNLIDKHLLVVDDNSINIELMLDLLDEYGYENVHGINDPHKVLSHCQQQMPDFLLLNFRMPHLDGYTVIEQLRAHFEERMPPIIVLTMQIDNMTRQRALAMGVRDFIPKPFKHDKVLQRIRNTLNIEQAIRGATERGEMSLVFQPKLSLADHKILGAEALLRWQHPELGLISPSEFIPLAEASGDILAIGDWALDEAMRHITGCRAQGLLNDDYHIAVNVAARQLTRKDFAQQLLARLEERQTPQRFFALEVTESGLMSDMNHARQQLAELARTITQLAHSVGCDVVAEGIENSAQATYLSSIGCEAA